MIFGLRLILIALAMLCAALVAGFFYAFDCCVMPGLAAAPAEVAVAAMQGINQAVRNPLFALSFFGTPAFALVAGVVGVAGRRRVAGVISLTALLVYAICVLAVTTAVNVPLNEALATVQPTGDAAHGLWADYAQPWSDWNRLRTIGAVATFLLLALALILASRPGRS